MQKLVSLLSLSFLVSCATVMPGYDVHTNSKDVSATVSFNEDFTDERIQLAQFALKNETNEWIELDGANIQASNNVTVLVGDRINSWIEACTIEKNVSDHNMNLVFGALAVGGAVIAGTSSHDTTSKTGAIVALGGISGIATREILNSKQKTEFVENFPERHIFHKIVIPPKKVIHRWILVENPKHEEIFLTMKNNKGNPVQLKIEGERPIAKTDNLDPQTQQKPL